MKGMIPKAKLAPWLLTVVAGWLAGCSKQAVVKDEIQVEVVAADAKAGTMTLRGKALPQAGPDGTQTVRVGAGDAAIGYVGHAIRGDLNQDKTGWRLDNIWPADGPATTTVDEAARRIHNELAERGLKAHRDVGDSLPGFALYNQDGQLVQASNLRGRRLVLNFIFTRCANPEMCPAATNRMAQLQKALQAANVDDVTLVTMTFDPAHDNPGLLRQYAQAYGLDLSNYQLLTGPENEVTDLMLEFGILTKQEDGTLKHTMATMLVSPEGRILYRKEGSAWTVAEFMERIKPAAPAAKPNS